MSTAYKDIDDAFRHRLRDNFSSLPRKYEGADFEPDGVNGFVYMVCMPLTDDQVSIGTGGGNRRFRKAGLCYFHIYTPANQGVKAALEYADEISTIFRGARFDGVVCRSARIARDVPQAAGIGNYILKSVAVEFYHDEIS